MTRERERRVERGNHLLIEVDSPVGELAERSLLLELGGPPLRSVVESESKVS